MKKNFVEKKQPVGKLVLCTLAMPTDTNPNGDIFGGWIMSQMDIAGGSMAQDLGKCRVVTVAAESIKFHRPAQVGDMISCYGRIIKIGTTSVTINLEVWAKHIQSHVTGDEAFYRITEAAFTYVAVDENGKKRPIRRNAPLNNE